MLFKAKHPSIGVAESKIYAGTITWVDKPSLASDEPGLRIVIFNDLGFWRDYPLTVFIPA